MASAGPYAILHLVPDKITTPAPHHSSLLQAGCPSCHPTNSVKALKEIALKEVEHTEAIRKSFVQLTA